MSDRVDAQMLSDWRANYGLDKRTPIKAMHWWQDNMDGKAPAGVVAALGLCINEIERLTAERDELRRQLDPMGEYASADELIAALRAEKAEDEAIKQDARRYRFIRDADRSDAFMPIESILSYSMDSLDAAIDAAMGLARPAEES